MNDARRKLAATFISALGIAGVGVAWVLKEGSTERLDSSAETNQIAAEETAIGGMTIANPFSTAIAAADAFDAADQDHSKAAATLLLKVDRASSDHMAPPDACEERHIAESQENHRKFLNEPEGQLKYEYLTDIQANHVPGLEPAVHQQLLLYHGRLALDNLLQEIETHPSDNLGNSDRYQKILDIIAKTPCSVDDYWHDCIAQSLGVNRDNVQNAHAMTQDLVDEQNLARLMSYENDAASPGEEKAIQEIYDSLAPLLARAIEGDEQTLRRFRLTPEEAERLVNKSQRQSTSSADSHMQGVSLESR